MPNGDGKITIVLANQQALFRDAVRAVLESEYDLEVVGEAREGYEAVSETVRTGADVVLLDAELTNCSAIRATSLIRERSPSSSVLMLSDRADLASLVQALEAGARGYLTKEHAISELIAATRAVCRGDVLVPPSMLGALLALLFEGKRRHEEALRRLSRLTRRERQVLALLVRGGDNEEIARTLVISPQTARTHVQNVLSKLGVHSRLEAAAFVTQSSIGPDLLA